MVWTLSKKPIRLTEEQRRFDRYVTPRWSDYLCPYCGDAVPGAAEPATWSCCGEIGRAVHKSEWDAAHAEAIQKAEAMVLCVRCGQYGPEEEGDFDNGKYICRTCADAELQEAEEFLNRMRQVGREGT